VVLPYTGPSIDTFVKEFGKYDLLAYMNKYWVSQGGPSPNFWGHEFSKHATCYSTFDAPCYGPEYVEHQDVIDFFQTAIMYYMRLPTYVWLAKKGITPSNSTTYTLSNMQAALTDAYGKVQMFRATPPYILMDCQELLHILAAAGLGTIQQPLAKDRQTREGQLSAKVRNKNPDPEERELG
jgi:ribonuclease T2